MLNWLWPEQINLSEPVNYYFNNDLAVVSEKTEENVNLKGEGIEIVSLIRDISYKATKERTKRPVKKKGRYGEPQSLTEVLKSPLLGQWLKVIFDESM